MRPIPVSIDVYAAIWADRRAGEDNEDAILRRKLGISTTAPPPEPDVPPHLGFSDHRFGIQLPKGFEIFRTYKGKEYRAKATDGKWVLDGTGAEFPSLNQLSHAVTRRPENAWNNWYFLKNGKRQLMMALRDKGSEFNPIPATTAELGQQSIKP